MPAVSSVAGKTSSLSSVRKRTYPIISGGTLTSDATYYYRTFTSNGTLWIINSTVALDAFAISGGAGGGGGYYEYWGFPESYSYRSQGGGGGAGGSRVLQSYPNAVGSYSIAIGAGGFGSQNTGGAGAPTEIPALAISTGISTGGTRGCAGAGGSNAHFTSTSGGGAGAGENSSGTTGGVGYTAFGTVYGSGGTGSDCFIAYYGNINGYPGTSASENTGSGGSGALGGYNYNYPSGGNGGSGVFRIRYLKSAVGD